MNRTRDWRWFSTGAAALLTACGPHANRTDAYAVMVDPVKFFSQTLELCGNLNIGEALSGVDGKVLSGFDLTSYGEEGSPQHGVVGVFIPTKPFLSRFVGKRTCVTGAIAHQSGLTPQEVMKRGYVEKTSSAVNYYWPFNAVSARLDRLDQQ